MPERLPPLNALRTFEAAARHLSFTAAAEELHVTAAAVSHQIRSLEEHLGTELFHRSNRALVLTEAGMLLLPDVREAFARLINATRGLRRHAFAGPLTVAVSPSFAAKWLVPRLSRFRARCPDIEVRLISSSELVDFGHEDVDLAIRYGTGRYPGLHAELLSETEFFPVCSPKLAQGPPPLIAPDDIRHVVLLHDEVPTALPTVPSWETWLKAAGVTGVDGTQGPRFNTSFFTLEMALSGMGIALAQSALVSGDLAEGRLVRLFSVSIPVELSFFLVGPLTAFKRPKVKAFRDWLHEEVGNVPHASH
jgi:LysR family transcriptional regulator, glycine cleavage system transcriptional activator